MSLAGFFLLAPLYGAHTHLSATVLTGSKSVDVLVCTKSESAPAARSESAPTASPPPEDAGGSPPSPTGSSTTGAPANYLADWRSLPNLIKQKLGGARVYYIAFTASWAGAVLEDPNRRGRIYRYAIVDGVLNEGDEVSRVDDLVLTQLSDLDSLPFDAVPAIVKEAPGRVGFPDGSVETVEISHDNVGLLTIRVLVAAPKPSSEKRSALFSPSGQFIKRD